MLREKYSDFQYEAGCDEAGRGCLAGPVLAAAVILPAGYRNPRLRDSKKLNARQREQLRLEIMNHAVTFAVASASSQEIDRMNILQATFLAMHRAIEMLDPQPGFLLIDGNRFNPCHAIPHQCIVNGDDLYLSIAAASILAKTARDEMMAELHLQFPHYGWSQNKGYPTPGHIQAILRNGYTPLHRTSFQLRGQLRLYF